ncbi:MAG TPA: Holliday junction resolvase RuvX [Syntrophomonadaceae bacterium]|nr:Holliday junction resolvase RuvX [Syntrophomonadaceae bacterium]
MRILGLDVGQKRIGVAISDELGIIAQPLTTVNQGKMEEVVESLRILVEKYDVGEIVVGLPRHMNGRLGREGEEIVSFGKELQKKLGVPVVFWDERLSTVAAEKALLEGDTSRYRRRKVIDRVAANWILGGYLERRKKKEGFQKD